MLEEQPTLNLNPKFQYGKTKNKFSKSDDVVLMTNYYGLTLNKDLKEIYQYSIDFQPILPADATKVADKIIQSAKKQIKNKLGYICFKGRMLWGSAKADIALIIKTQVTIKDEKQSYEITIKPNTKITIDEFISRDEKNLGKLSQALNINAKNVLRTIGFKELDKGKFYNDEEFETQFIKDAGLSVWRGYQVNVVSANNKLYLKVDACSRLLRIQNFLQTMKDTNKINDKQFINQTFKESSIITRYGNHRILRIQQIDYTISPKSTFYNSKSQQKQTYIEYYKSVYQCNIKDANQPLIKIIVRNCDKDEVQYIIPELVSLTGLSDTQKADFHIMKGVADKTKLRVDQRVTETNKIVMLLNKEGDKQLMYTIKQKPQQFPGSILQSPAIQIGNKKQIFAEKGSFNLRDHIKDPIHLKNYYFVYTTRGDRDDQDADACIKFLKDSSKSFGIKVSDPSKFIDIRVNRNERLSAKDWIQQIQIQTKTGIPDFVILYFNNEEMKDKQLYEKLKSHLIHKLKLNSQVITKRTLSVGAKGGMSKASKILLQINDKMGHPLYKVQKQHPFWEKSSIAIGSLAVSQGPKGKIASFVGTRNNQLTQNYSDFLRVDKKQSISQINLSTFIQSWLKQYYKSQNKKLPGTIILYRQGLNQKQAQKVLQDEINTIQKTFQSVSQKAKVQNWKPNFIYILVNQKTGTRIYNMDRSNKLSNPLPGTIVGSQISKDGSYEFLMASASTTEGTCNMVQYHVSYDSSNQNVPDEAVKMITYEQCYNYPNWAGSIRFPATLQKANKLAKFVSTHGQGMIQKDNPLKVLDYYI